MARVPKELFTQFQDQLNNEQEVRDVSIFARVELFRPNFVYCFAVLRLENRNDLIIFQYFTI